ncbi:hypothetical protein [Thioalkalivibrio sp. HK1]|uniref:hypothetical protein n=1 Tax=Thioalkalivibrio sp. HK1 TaxID=1469245 RepID=UPI0012DBE3EF|nr:hypothetical protein [Thioalkalivibrio sp. HK1]
MSAEPTRNDNAAGDETLVDRRDNPSQTLDQLSADLDSIHCEDVFTDTKLATIRRLKPVDRKGDHDASRPTLYIAETTIVSQLGPIPVQAPIDANSLEEAFLKFPEAIKTAVDDLSARAQEIRREEASRIVVPGTGAMPPAGGGAPGGGRLVY